jgi:hypothetical protein
VVGRRGTTWRGQPAVVGGQVLRQEDVRCLRNAQDNVDAAGGGSARSGIVKALGGGRAASVAPFSAIASTTRWGGLGWKVE